MTSPIIPNRAQRRQMMRSQGWRGSKAKRQFPNRTAHLNMTAETMAQVERDQAEAVAEHERRNALRAKGLQIPPTPEEVEHLKATGKIDHDPRLHIPGR